MGQGNRRTTGRRTRTPHVYVRKDRGYYYAAGTLQTSAGRVRLTGTTGIKADEPDAEARAEAWLFETLIPRLLRESQTGVKEIPFSTAVVQYLRHRYPSGMVSQGLGKPTNSTERAAQELAGYFQTRPLPTITAADIDHYYAERFTEAKAATIRRHQNTLTAIFRFHKVPVPPFDIAVVRASRGSSVTKSLTPAEVHILIGCFPVRLKALMALYFVTGARVSELLYLTREHFPGCSRVTIPHTKNGDARVIDLPNWVQTLLRDHLASHSHLNAFLTDKGRPYRPAINHGGQIRRAVNNARERAAQELSPERAAVMRQFTPHWCRHTFANALLDEGIHVRDIQEAGGWRSSQVLETNYLASQRQVASRTVAALPYANKQPPKSDAG